MSADPDGGALADASKGAAGSNAHDVANGDDASDAASAADIEAVTALLGRPPTGRFSVVVRHADGTPRVIRNHPFLDDGTPMPTLFWLVSPIDSLRIGRLEGARGVDRAEQAIGLDDIAEAHDRYAAARAALIPPGTPEPHPSGGVGGTRRGVKCLHAHWAWHLAGGDDPVGRWIAERLDAGEGDRP